MGRRGRAGRRPRPTFVVLALIAAVAVGAGAALVIGQLSKPTSSAARARGASAAGTRPTAKAGPDPWRAALRGALAKGRRQAESYGGWVDAAVWAKPWSAPVVLGAHSFRLWSVSKPITAVAVLRAAEAAHRSLGSGLTGSMVDALARSDNCAQRRVLVALQRLSGGPAKAHDAIRDVLAVAGASARGSAQAKPLKYVALCAPYLQAHADGLSAGATQAPALLLGTYQWTVRDAVSFAFALGSGRYGSAGHRVLSWMRQPKKRAVESLPRDYTSPLGLPPSGGRFPAAWRPAYKGGWGGHQQRNFLAEQIVVLDVAGRTVALAAVFRPNDQPPSDDPGGTAAPRALESVFTAVQHQLARLSTHRLPSAGR
jgi:hypothetical protein